MCKRRERSKILLIFCLVYVHRKVNFPRCRLTFTYWPCFVLVRFQFNTWQFKCVSGVSCSGPNHTDTDLTQLVPSPSATPATATSSAVLDTSQATMSPVAFSSVLNSNFVDPSLSPASSSTSGAANITDINPNFVHPSLLAAPSSTSDATNITDINPNFVHPSLLAAPSSTSDATNITDINPNFVHPSLLPPTSTNNNATNMKSSLGSSLAAVLSSPLSPTAASSLSTLLTVSSSVSPPASGTENTRNYPPHFQYFMVTSSVVFIKVPAVKSQRVKRSVYAHALKRRSYAVFLFPSSWI